MSAIGPGDWLECVDAKSSAPGLDCALTLGARYQVEAVYDYLPHAGTDESWMDCAVDLVGVAPPRDDLAWGLYRFKPIDEGQSPITRKVCTPVERETAGV